VDILGFVVGYVRYDVSMLEYLKKSSTDFKISLIILALATNGIVWFKIAVNDEDAALIPVVNLLAQIEDVIPGSPDEDDVPEVDSFKVKNDEGEIWVAPEISRPASGSTEEKKKKSSPGSGGVDKKTEHDKPTPVDLFDPVETTTPHALDTAPKDSPNGLSDERFVFNKNLELGVWHSDVVRLQKILTKEGFLDYPDTGYFGLATYNAVLLYQQAHFDEIGYVTGFVGSLTRAVLNK